MILELEIEMLTGLYICSVKHVRAMPEILQRKSEAKIVIQDAIKIFCIQIHEFTSKGMKHYRFRCIFDAPLKPNLPPDFGVRPDLKFFCLESPKSLAFPLEPVLLPLPLLFLSNIFFFSILALLAAGPDRDDLVLLARAVNRSEIKVIIQTSFF